MEIFVGEGSIAVNSNVFNTSPFEETTVEKMSYTQ